MLNKKWNSVSRIEPWMMRLGQTGLYNCYSILCNSNFGEIQTISYQVLSYFDFPREQEMRVL